jgi:hypothetical protein
LRNRLRLVRGDRGLLAARVEYGPLGLGRDAVTSYTWDPKWERVTGVAFPELNTVSFAYDESTGNRLWQQVGPDAARRVDFTYYGAGVNGERLLASVFQTADGQGVRARDSVMYDAFGSLAETRQAVGTTTEGVTRLTNDAAGRPIRTSVDIVAGGAQQQRDSTEYDLMDRVVRTRSYGFGTTRPRRCSRRARTTPRGTGGAWRGGPPATSPGRRSIRSLPAGATTGVNGWSPTPRPTGRSSGACTTTLAT